MASGRATARLSQAEPPAHWSFYIFLSHSPIQIARRELNKLEAVTVVHGTREIESSLRLVKRRAASDETG